MSEAKWEFTVEGGERVARKVVWLSEESVRGLVLMAAGVRDEEGAAASDVAQVRAVDGMRFEVAVPVERRFTARWRKGGAEGYLPCADLEAARKAAVAIRGDADTWWVSEEERPAVDGEPWREVRRHPAVPDRQFRVVSRDHLGCCSRIELPSLDAAGAVWDAFKRTRPAEDHVLEERVGSDWVRLEKVGGAWVPVRQKGWRCIWMTPSGMCGAGEVRKLEAEAQKDAADALGARSAVVECELREGGWTFGTAEEVRAYFESTRVDAPVRGWQAVWASRERGNWGVELVRAAREEAERDAARIRTDPLRVVEVISSEESAIAAAERLLNAPLQAKPAPISLNLNATAVVEPTMDGWVTFDAWLEGDSRGTASARKAVADSYVVRGSLGQRWRLKMQLWELMQVFGHRCFMGAPQLFADNYIEVQP